jgi:DNA replication licensing factor MCM2
MVRSDLPEGEDEPPRRRQRLTDRTDNNDDGDRSDAFISSSHGNDSRAARLAALAARRRRAQLQQEVLELAGDGEDFVEVPDRQFVVDDDEDEETNPDEFINADDDEDEDGEDLIENAERDYQRIEALDTYGTEGIDDADYDPLDQETREAAEREIARRERASGGAQHRTAGFYGMMVGTLEDEEDEEARQARRGMFGRRSGDGGAAADFDEDENLSDEDDNLDGDDPINLDAFDVPLREWIAQDRTRREIQRRFRVFLRHFEPEDTERRRRANGIYQQKIRSMCASNGSSLQVSYVHLMESEPVLAFWLADAPKDMLLVLDEAATRHTVSMFPSYAAIKSEIHVRVRDVPISDSLRDLRRQHLDSLVKVHGVVTRRSSVYPQLQLAYYTCGTCKRTQGPYRTEQGVGAHGDVSAMHMPEQCPNCDVAYFRLHPTMSVYRNMQRLNLQESPGSVPPGRVPRTKEVLVTDDLIDIARPGEEVEVTGIFEHSFDSTLTIKTGFPVFSTFIYANNVSKREDASSASNLSDSDIRKIIELSRDPKIGERIVRSIAPSIFGHDFCKMALAMSLFGGVPKNVNDKHRIRGDVNVLLLGDPGTAKSQLLKYAQHTAPRAVYSTGKGASAVGLTASVHKDPISKEWTLEGGALVLADRGVYHGPFRNIT